MNTQDRLQEAKDLLRRTEGHTSAPWLAYPDWRTGKYSTIEANGLSEAVAEIPHDDCNSQQLREIKKNFRLISTAPNLRDLLTWAVVEVEKLREGLDWALDHAEESALQRRNHPGEFSAKMREFEAFLPNGDSSRGTSQDG